VPGFTRTIRRSTTGGPIAFVGRPAPEKGVHLLMEAARRLPHVPFAIAGDPAATRGLRDSAPDNVDFRGFLSNDELAQFHRQSRAIVVPSQWFEGFPNVILNAMQHGRPVIASRIGGLPEIVIHEQTRLLHTPHSVDELVSAIERLHGNDDFCRRLGQNGAARLTSEYSEDIACQRLMRIYNHAGKRLKAGD